MSMAVAEKVKAETEKYQQAIAAKARDEEARSRLEGEVRRKAHTMLKSYKEHRASTMIAEHQRSNLTLSGVKATDETRFQRKKREKS